MTPFKDYFSTQSADYARYRPRYPAELFAWLAQIAPAQTTAWDCATGNGQAALGLAEHFARVIATDPSEQQLASAVPHTRVAYHRARGEESGLPPASVDLVTIAQALHWLEHPAFWREVHRVLRPGGVVAAWGYDVLAVSPEVDAAVRRFYDSLAGYWAPERRIVEERYRSVEFPFIEIAHPAFDMHAEWTRAQLAGYVRTWSAVRARAGREGRDPVVELERELADVWPDADEQRLVRWPLFMRVGRTTP